ncbi:MAG: HEAT repeat domain-containing protein [Spirochaetota bacterium]
MGAGRLPLALTGVLLLALCQSSSAADLPPLFKLPAGGRPLAPPLLDSRLEPPAVWFLSEDRNLYLLAETGTLIGKYLISPDPLPFLAIDPFGRALLLLDASDGPMLAVYTRSGSLSWRINLRNSLGEKGELPAATFGADGRILLSSGTRLRCLSPVGTALWNFELSAKLALAPVMDGAGNFLLGLADGTIVSLSPYGAVLGKVQASGRLTALGAISLAGEAGFSGSVGHGDGRVSLVGTGSSKLVGIPAFGGGKPIVSLVSSLEAGRSLVYALDEAGTLAAFTPEGSRLWKTETAVSKGSISLGSTRIVVSGRGRAVSLSKGGEVYREATITNTVSDGLLSPSGLLFSAGADWILSAYRFEASLGALESPAVAPYAADGEAVAWLLRYDLHVTEGDHQLSLIADIEKNLDSARLGGREAGARAILVAIARGDFLAAFPPSQRRFKVSALAEAEACRVLGRIGSPESIEVLAKIADSEADPAVRSSALEALGAIGVDPAGRSRAAFLGVTAGSRIDDQVALALIAAIESMNRKSGVPPSVEAARALLALSGPPYAQSLRDRAVAALGRVARGY